MTPGQRARAQQDRRLALWSPSSAGRTVFLCPNDPTPYRKGWYHRLPVRPPFLLWPASPSITLARTHPEREEACAAAAIDRKRKAPHKSVSRSQSPPADVLHAVRTDLSLGLRGLWGGAGRWSAGADRVGMARGGESGSGEVRESEYGTPVDGDCGSRMAGAPSRSLLPTPLPARRPHSPS